MTRMRKKGKTPGKSSRRDRSVQRKLTPEEVQVIVAMRKGDLRAAFGGLLALLSEAEVRAILQAIHAQKPTDYPESLTAFHQAVLDRLSPPAGN